MIFYGNANDRSNPPSYFTILNNLYAKFTQYLFILNRNLFNSIANSIDFMICQCTHERIEDIYQYILCCEVCLVPEMIFKIKILNLCKHF